MIPISPFQSTHPHGVRRRFQSRCLPDFPVSIHAPTWGATRFRLPTFASMASFNPRTHMGCDRPCASRFNGCTKVSIHAPTWGATGLSNNMLTSYQVSIHAPTWGATTSRRKGSRKLLCFNPRTHMGCDSGIIAISGTGPRMFQSTHPHGVRQRFTIIKQSSCKFQSTHPHGDRKSVV